MLDSKSKFWKIRPHHFSILRRWYIWKYEGKIFSTLPILQTSAKYVQTTRVVCTNFSCSLYRLQLKSPESTTYLQIYVRVLTEISTCTHLSICVYLRKCLPRTYFGEYDMLSKSWTKTFGGGHIRPKYSISLIIITFTSK